MTSNYIFGILDLRLLITYLVSSNFSHRIFLKVDVKVLPPPLFIEVTVPREEIVTSYINVVEVSILPLFLRCFVELLELFGMCVFFFHFINNFALFIDYLGSD